MPAKKEIPFPERRKYVRLDSVFPVQFRLLEPDGNNFLSDWIQGFTSNIGSGGICLEVNKLKPEVLQAIRSRQARFALEIEMPLGAHPVKAKTSIVWVKDDPDEPGGRCIIGLAYENIDPAQNHRIVRYALTKKLVAPLALAFGLIFAAGFGINTYYNFKLIEGNRALVTKLLGVLQDSALAKQKMTQIIQDKEGLQLKLQSLQQRIGSLEEEKAAIKEEAGKINQLNALIEKLNLEKSGLQKQLTELRHRENAVNYELVNLEKKKAVLEQINFDKMYQWLKVHQNPRTGLVMSFEGDGNLSNAAFIYDQSLATQVYTIYSDFERARKVFDFFENKAERKDGRFLNAYYANDGSPAEFIVHSGPNIWLGIAVLQYTAKSRDRAYLNLAEEIARSMIALQNEDPESGIRGGPDVSWYATEHNLDAYAFFNMLYTTIPKKEYGLARDKALAWLVSHTYDSTEVPIKRGKGDSTIATDTYAW
ncbi:MAG: PilZ domain-containing protein, partial [Deltaproteobacteria bacterium]